MSETTADCDPEAEMIRTLSFEKVARQMPQDVTFTAFS